MRKNAFSLMEVLLVLIILGILVSLSVITYTRSNIKNNEENARNMLYLIRDAQATHRMEDPAHRYVNCSNTSDCNSVLGLAITGPYIYKVSNADNVTFTAEADHTSSSYWSYTFGPADTCPVQKTK